MDELKYEITDAGGVVSVPLDAVISDDENIGDRIRELIKAEGEKIGKSKVKLSQLFSEETMSYQVVWEWME